jgi:hypothetical protein
MALVSSRSFPLAQARRNPTGAIVILLTFRQWHQGGRIPFSREPEHFHVDTIPENETR